MSEEPWSEEHLWIRERLQAGNWIDIAPDEEMPAGIQGWERTIIHMHQICFGPEIRRRKDKGQLPQDFFLWACQLIQPHDGGQIIRLNDEVRGVKYIRVDRAVEKGEQIQLSDLRNLEIFDLHDDELDCGHFTMFFTGETWVGSFDFRAGRAKCLDLLEKSLVFARATKLCVENRLAEAAIDNLHTACELIAKAKLILQHYPAHQWKSHGSVSSHINREGRLGNVSASFLALFNKLSESRSHAKYATGYHAELPSNDDVDLVESMVAVLQDSIIQKRPPSSEESSN